VKRLGVALTMGVVLCTPAVAAEPATELRLSYHLTDEGRGELIANPVPDGSWGSVTWQACGATGSCVTAHATDANNRVLDVGDAAAGTTFIATASDGFQSVSAKSEPYLGRIHDKRPPAISGRLRTGHSSSPSPDAGTVVGAARSTYSSCRRAARPTTAAAR
jgi:hypothetical protein